MHYIFCTLFDKNYLYKGLALYQSLSINCKKFTLWILCMDKKTYFILQKMRLKNVKLIRLEDFEDDALREAKQERTVAEYCWTCASCLILYVIQKKSHELVTYLDADLFFYSDPCPIYDELGGNPILIIEHRFSLQYQAWERRSGKYNVSMVIFRNDSSGQACLKWWKEQCLQACTLDCGAGQCGDQKYLDDWPSRFNNVVVLNHKGGGLAPWNIDNYNLHTNNGKVFVDFDELIFYHFHSLQIIDKSLFTKHPFLASEGYRFKRKQLSLVYRPYVRYLRDAIAEVERISPGFAWGYKRMRWRDMLRAFLRGNLLLA